MEFDNYGSHLRVFEKVFATFETKKVLEFGLGQFSTPFFVNHAELVVSVEQESKEWYERIKARIHSANWCPVFSLIREQYSSTLMLTIKTLIWFLVMALQRQGV